MNLQNALLRLPRDGPERQAIEAGEIDAVIDYASSNVILFPAARRAVREVANREAASEASITNNLLAALPHTEYQRLLAGFEPVRLKSGEVLHEPGAPIRHVYFPIDCVICLVTTVERHRGVGVGLVGHEGMVGISLALGIDIPFTRALVQETGTAIRMESALFRQKLLESKALQQALYCYQHALIGQIARSAACNQLHPMQARIARYLLMTSDRARSRGFRLTHEFLADMLGVRRASVTSAASVLQKRMLIKYSRGDISILDRKGLNAAACGCYKILKDLHASASVAARSLPQRPGESGRSRLPMSDVVQIASPVPGRSPG